MKIVILQQRKNCFSNTFKVQSVLCTLQFICIDYCLFMITVCYVVKSMKKNLENN